MRRRFKLQIEPGGGDDEPAWGLWCSGCGDWVYTAWGHEPALWDYYEETLAARRTVVAICLHKKDRIRFFVPRIYTEQ